LASADYRRPPRTGKNNPPPEHRQGIHHNYPDTELVLLLIE